MASATDPFLTADEVTITPDDAVAGASGIVRAACHWHIWPSITETVTLPAPGGDVLVLPTLQLTDVTSISVKISATADVETVDPAIFQDSNDDYPSNGVLTRQDGYRWPCTGTVTVAFTHGYTSLPAELKAVVQSLAKRWPVSASPWTQRRMGSASVSIGNTGSVQVGSLTSVEAMVLDRYTLPGEA